MLNTTNKCLPLCTSIPKIDFSYTLQSKNKTRLHPMSPASHLHSLLPELPNLLPWQPNILLLQLFPPTIKQIALRRHRVVRRERHYHPLLAHLHLSHLPTHHHLPITYLPIKCQRRARTPVASSVIFHSPLDCFPLVGCFEGLEGAC